MKIEIEILNNEEIKIGERIIVVSSESVDRSWIGDSFNVKKINLPFITIKRISEYQHNRSNVVLDLRTYKVKIDK